MKMFRSALALSLMFAAGTALAAGHDPQTTKPASNTAQQVPVDHSKMKMDGAMPMDHGKMADAEFVKFDQNKDGKISKSEVPAKHAMTAHFGMLDADKDARSVEHTSELQSLMLNSHPVFFFIKHTLSYL